MTRYPTKSHLMEEEFVLEHILRCQGRHVSRIVRYWSHCICSWEAKSEQEVKPAIKHEGPPPPNDQRPPAGLYLLKFHNLLKGNNGENVLKCMNLWVSLYIRPP